MKIQNLLLIIAVSLIFLASCQSQNKTNKDAKVKEIAKSGIITKTYTLEGFKQSCCTGIVNYSLKEVNGYIKSEANVKNQQLTVWFDNKKCDERAIKKAINKTPYKIVNSL
ncbi:MULTISPECIES: heavy-metal-associated domain-containing protein [unclassified Tenacibaculum]|uniref:heavy-metal-associated domain-containing protein n=1 Tax=unclassified Tenacibaculum TaxID=2635139 RepID=UPI001F323170|nr:MULTISPECIES: hypothetical protein [unclassified Tenacibaculum]MCF2876530.1 hypothetical protein [Tenacibaculum sp. Cn5-1]MCF2936563.1 hypothetical protein [Tenacibaculum sp. Cn5-34]MCG7511844.1 hypothetical protein [Tenacibaculum sp. Cn5-46]